MSFTTELFRFIFYHRFFRNFGSFDDSITELKLILKLIFTHYALILSNITNEMTKPRKNNNLSRGLIHRSDNEKSPTIYHPWKFIAIITRKERNFHETQSNGCSINLAGFRCLRYEIKLVSTSFPSMRMFVFCLKHIAL